MSPSAQCTQTASNSPQRLVRHSPPVRPARRKHKACGGPVSHCPGPPHGRDIASLHGPYMLVHDFDGRKQRLGRHLHGGIAWLRDRHRELSALIIPLGFGVGISTDVFDYFGNSMGRHIPGVQFCCLLVSRSFYLVCSWIKGFGRDLGCVIVGI